MTAQSWQPEAYQRNAGFVAAYGADLLGEWFEPGPGMRVLDLGCGDGPLTRRIAETGAEVVGIDSSAQQIEAARALGLEAYVMDGERMDTARLGEASFDACFTNAALHWMRDRDAVAAGVATVLKPGGVFVGEFGGFGNVAAIVTAMQAVGASMGGDPALGRPGTYPTVKAFTACLERAGFAVERMLTFYRPTPLPTDIRGWLETMRAPFFDQFGNRRENAYAAVIAALEPTLRDDEGRWFADYVRLRFRAKLMPH